MLETILGAIGVMSIVLLSILFFIITIGAICCCIIHWINLILCTNIAYSLTNIGSLMVIYWIVHSKTILNK